jgi:hypothetical protein
MIWGMTPATFTQVHVVLSSIGIGAGLIVLLGLLAGERRDGWTCCSWSPRWPRA